MPNLDMRCPKCGSSAIIKDASATWSVATQEWELAGVYDHESCADCEAEADDLFDRVETDATPSQPATDDEDAYPPRCTNPHGHSWVENEQSGAAYCEYCLADGDA